MDSSRLKKHIQIYQQKSKENPAVREDTTRERLERAEYYQAWTADRIRAMSKDDLYEYIAKLWAMLIWGNKQYVFDKLIEDNGFDALKNELAQLVWGKEEIPARWDHFRKTVKGMGPAMISEILCHTHPDACMLWNRRALVGLRYLGLKNLPRYNYQLTGKRYAELTDQAQKIARVMRESGIEKANLLTVDYFIWEELQVEGNLSQIHKKSPSSTNDLPMDSEDQTTDTFIHNEVRDKLADVGQWLGFHSRTEIKVADGSKVDTIWEATIGNMGRVIYVFEVQTKGSIDSLILNLLKSLNNPAVQGVVAVSDASQIERIKKHAAGVPGLRAKLKYWDYKQVLHVHEALESVNETINSLGLVPQGFWKT